MARLFVAASSQEIESAIGSPHPLAALPFSFAGWCRKTSTHNGVIIGMAIANTGTNFVAIMSSSLGGFKLRTRAGATSLSEQTGSSYASDVWWHVAGVWRSATDREIYINGVTDGTFSTSVTPSANMSTTSIGFMGDSTHSDWLDGSSAHVAMWNVALSVTDIRRLALGRSPLTVRRDALHGYWPLDGISSPEPDLSGRSPTGVLANAPTMSLFHPPVPGSYVAPSRSWTHRAPAAAATRTLWSSPINTSGMI